MQVDKYPLLSDKNKISFYIWTGISYFLIARQNKETIPCFYTFWRGLWIDDRFKESIFRIWMPFLHTTKKIRNVTSRSATCGISLSFWFFYSGRRPSDVKRKTKSFQRFYFLKQWSAHVTFLFGAALNSI